MTTTTTTSLNRNKFRLPESEFQTVPLKKLKSASESSDEKFRSPSQIKLEELGAGYVVLRDVVNRYVTHPKPEVMKNILVIEILGILKNPKMDLATKRERVDDSFLLKISDEDFQRLLFCSNSITDDFNFDGVKHPVLNLSDVNLIKHVQYSVVPEDTSQTLVNQMCCQVF